MTYMRLESSGFRSPVIGFGDIIPEVAWRSHAIRRFHGASRDPVHQV